MTAFPDQIMLAALRCLSLSWRYLIAVVDTFGHLAISHQEYLRSWRRESFPPVKLPRRERASFKQQVGPAWAQGKKSGCSG